MMTLTDIYFGKNAHSREADYCPTQAQAYEEEYVAENEKPMTQEECDAKMAEGVAYFNKWEKFVKRHNLWSFDWEEDAYWWNLWLAEWA